MDLINQKRIPLGIGLLLVILFSILWVTVSLNSQDQLQQEISNQILVADTQLEIAIEEKVDIINSILLTEWLNTKNKSKIFDLSRFNATIPAFYDFYDGYLSINLVSKSGVILAVYPNDPNSLLINESILINVDGSPNLTIQKANQTGEISISTYVTFYQGGTGLSSYIPFYYNSSEITGYFNVVFRTNPLFQTFVDNHPNLKEKSWFQIKENDTIVYQHGDNFDLNGKFVKHTTIDYYNQSWDLYLTPNDNLIRETSPWAHIAILLTGLITAAFVVFVSRYLVRINIIQEERHQDRECYKQVLSRYEKMNSLGTMAGGMAHDFNNILMIIEGNLSILEAKYRENADQTDLLSLDDLFGAIEQGKNLTKEILSFSRHQVTNNSPIELIELLKNRIEVYSTTIDADLTIDLITELRSVNIFGEKGKLSQIIFNILNNSYQAKANHVIVSVKLKNEPTQKEKEFDDKVVVKFKDNGIGIDSESIDLIFDPFFTTKEIGKGSGLGLAIAYTYLTSIGGNITATVETEGGLSISIELPVIKNHDHEDNNDDILYSKDIVAECGRICHDKFGKNFTVLIVEDDQSISSIISRIYEQIGGSIIHAGDGLQALRKFREIPNIDLIILDVNLPKLNGAEVFDIIIKENPTQFVIFVTGYAEQLSLIDFDNYSNVTVLSKPFSQAELCQKTITLLE